jgi:hypothetical protein
LLALASVLATGCPATKALPLARIVPLDFTDDNVMKVAVSRDGDRFVLGGGVHAVYLWTAPWGRPTSIQIAGGQTSGPIAGVGFLDDGRIYGADSEHVEIWGPTLERRESQVKFPSDPHLRSTRVIVSPSGRFIAIEDAVLDVTSGRLSIPPFGHGHLTAMAFEGNTHFLTAGFHDQQVRVTGLPSGPEAIWAAPDRVVAAAVTHDGALVLAGTEGAAFLWSPGSKEPRGRWGWADIKDVCLLGDGRSAVVLAGRKLHVIDVATLREASSVRLQSDGTALACDGDLVATGDEHGGVYAYDASRGQLFGRAGDLRGGVSLIAVSGRARRVLAVANSNSGAQLVLLGVP